MLTFVDVAYHVYTPVARRALSAWTRLRVCSRIFSSVGYSFIVIVVTVVIVLLPTFFIFVVVVRLRIIR